MVATLECRCGTWLRIEPFKALRCSTCGRAYPCEDGLVMLDADGPSDDDYPEELYGVLDDVEERHFWFGCRNEVILDRIRRVGEPATRTVLDIGCGSGVVLRALEQAGMRVCGLDMHVAALTRARRRLSGLLVKSSATSVPFPAQFDWVTLCDVIEHVEDDVACLVAAAEAARPGGHVLVTVPADPGAWSAYDEAIGHKRRYTRSLLVAAMVDAGLQVVDARYFNALLLLVQRAERRRRHGAPGQPRTELVRRALRVPMAPVNRVLGWVSMFERRVCRLRFPFGASLIAVGRPGADRAESRWRDGD